jgi:hypothetical protein
VSLAPVVAYCEEEVRRQGHDTSNIDGIERVGWMLNAWSAAFEDDFHPLDLLTIRSLGQIVEPRKNRNGFRKCGVRVGNRICPRFSEVAPMLKVLIANCPKEPLDFYRAFEEIHPFVDGNGRTGKILLNALNGTLLNPVFPPNDFWGTPIQNP